MFKKGDKVIAIKASHGWGRVNKGDIGVVSSTSMGIVYIDFPNQNGWCASEGDLKLANKSPEPKFKRNEKVVIKNGLGTVFKDGVIGTIVEYKNDSKGYYYLVSAKHEYRGDLVTQYVREGNLSKGFKNNEQALKLLRRD